MPILARQLPARDSRVFAQHAHLSGITLSVTLEDLDGRRLARPVGPEDRKHFAVSDIEVHVPHGLQLPVGLRQTPDVHRGIHECASALFLEFSQHFP